MPPRRQTPKSGEKARKNSDVENPDQNSAGQAEIEEVLPTQNKNSSHQPIPPRNERSNEDSDSEEEKAHSDEEVVMDDIPRADARISTLERKMEIYMRQLVTQMEAIQMRVGEREERRERPQRANQRNARPQRTLLHLLWY